MRVPVFTGHSLQLNARFERAISVAAGPGAARGAPGVVVTDVPTPLQAAGADPSFVGRIRVDETVDNGLALFVLQRQPAQGRRAQRGPDRRAPRQVTLWWGRVPPPPTGSGSRSTSR